MRPKALALTLTLAGWGCSANTSATLARMESEMRRMRSEQERQASQLDVLQHRVVLTEDAAQQARRAVAATDIHRATIRLGVEPAAAEPIRVDSTSVRAGEPEGPDESNLPAVRISRNERIPEREPFVVHPNDRLPVAPVPPLPAGPRSPSGAPAPAPAPPPPPGITPPRNGHAPVALDERAPGTLDPRAATAYDAALALARGNRCAEAVEAFAGFLVRWPAHPHADNAMYWRAECFLRSGDAPRGVRELQGLLERFPVGNKVPDALFTLRTALLRAGDAAGAERAGQRLLNDHADSEAARRLRDEREGGR
ncbi:MAG: tetratricopeptide repeat protein [Myxococcales bacterium]|nr:tetratricopeptide repeat protein [Myxococcales bacterium]